MVSVMLFDLERGRINLLYRITDQQLEQTVNASWIHTFLESYYISQFMDHINATLLVQIAWFHHYSVYQSVTPLHLESYMFSVFHRTPLNSCIPSYKLTLPGTRNQPTRRVHELAWPRLPRFQKRPQTCLSSITVDPADYHLLGMCINGSFIFTVLYLLVYDPPPWPANARLKQLLTFQTIMASQLMYIPMIFMPLLYLKHLTPILHAWTEFFQSSVYKRHQTRTPHPTTKQRVSEYRSTLPVWF